VSDHIRLSGFDIRAAFPDDKFVDAASFDALQSETTALRADLAQVTAERDRAMEALRKYGHHLAECDYIVNMYECSCGMDQVRAALAPSRV
jgi:hypothetical protein